MLQDALSEVTQIYPPLKLRVFVEDIAAFMNGKIRKWWRSLRKVLKKLKSKVGRRASLKAGRKERARKSLTASSLRRVFRNAARKKELSRRQVLKRLE